MKSLTLRIPDTADVDENEVALIVASQLFERGKLSSGQAAEIVGLSKAAFLEVIGKYGVSPFGQSRDELDRDLKNA